MEVFPGERERLIVNDILHSYNSNGEEEHYSEGQMDVPVMPLDETHPVWAPERIELKSVGIDIGSSTTHLMFSHLVLRRQGISLSSKFRVVKSEVIYKSPILLTPFVAGTIIDIQTLSVFFEEAYREAKISPNEVDTGAVIITGEAARKENAEVIVSLFSKWAGKFVCAIAGPSQEARVAAYGSGAVEKSRDGGARGSAWMNVDVGGGTSKIGIAQSGSLVDTAVLNVGSRLFVLDEGGRIVHIEKPGHLVVKECGLHLRVGDKMSQEEKREVAKTLAKSLFEVMGRNPLSPLTQKLMITVPLSFERKIEAVMFSGGVSEYIYGYEKRDYGDLGSVLAEEIRQCAECSDFGIPLKQSGQGIRATVIGASQYAVQVSGSTIFISEDNLLPLRNLPVVAIKISEENLTSQGMETTIRGAIRHLDAAAVENPIALALHWPLEPAYPSLKALVRGVLSALEDVLKRNMPLVLVFNSDIGRLIGNLLSQELKPGYKIISIDGVELQDFDYIDIGKEISGAGVVPVVIKSLIFHTGKF